MADSAVIVFAGLRLLGQRFGAERCGNKANDVTRSSQIAVQSDYILVLIVRERDRKLMRSIWFLEWEASAVARRDTLMTIRADRRLRSLEELLAVTPQTSIMIRIIRDIGIGAGGGPIVGRYCVTGTACVHMLLGRMIELRIVTPCFSWRRSRASALSRFLPPLLEVGQDLSRIWPSEHNHSGGRSQEDNQCSYSKFHLEG
jgi:hypothetical protein